MNSWILGCACLGFSIMSCKLNSSLEQPFIPPKDLNEATTRLKEAEIRAAELESMEEELKGKNAELERTKRRLQLAEATRYSLDFLTFSLLPSFYSFNNEKVCQQQEHILDRSRQTVLELHGNKKCSKLCCCKLSPSELFKISRNQFHKTQAEPNCQKQLSAIRSQSLEFHESEKSTSLSMAC